MVGCYFQFQFPNKLDVESSNASACYVKHIVILRVLVVVMCVTFPLKWPKLSTTILWNNRSKF